MRREDSHKWYGHQNRRQTSKDRDRPIVAESMEHLLGKEGEGSREEVAWWIVRDRMSANNKDHKRTCQTLPCES